MRLDMIIALLSISAANDDPKFIADREVCISEMTLAADAVIAPVEQKAKPNYIECLVAHGWTTDGSPYRRSDNSD
jgi:hypothetical protein